MESTQPWSQPTDILHFHKGLFRLDAWWMGITASLGQRAHAVPGHSSSLNLNFINMLPERAGSEGTLPPATHHDRGRAEAKRSLENQSQSDVQLAVQVQSMSHSPKDRASASVLRRLASFITLLQVKTIIWQERT
jgi:hypothetical protein